MPAPTNKLKSALRAGKAQTGLWLSLANSYSAELLGDAGFDWLLIDGEHSPNDLQTIMQQLQVLRFSESSVLVRPPVGEPWLIKQLLDAGAQSLLIPMVESRAQAELLVKSVRYPPRGIRGVGAGSARASHFGHIADYTATADAEILLMLQVETRAGVAALDDIASTDGVDCVFIGPADLSADMGHLGNPFAPEVQAVIEDAFRRIIGHGKAAGVYMANPDYARRYLELGATFIALGSDASLLSQGAAQLKSLYA
ncbi:MAG: HpcH/HpaI aldolase/citrate lyase family protein [Rhizobium sp.]|nr:HpcH/HpaI aldolase/citrate lyase family protein [Rhizobium sp.]